MERLTSNIDFNSDRLIFLYGINTMDRFITNDYREVDIYEGLHELLLEKGFECILFYSHTGRIFFMDENSREYCRVPEVNPNTNADSSVASQPIRFKGPLGTKRSQLLVARETAQERSSNHRNNTRTPTIGDSYALELIDWVMRATERKSAVVICQAETSLRYFTLLGAQAGRMGEWVRLSPTTNKNKCILIYECDDLLGKSDENQDFIPIPAFQNLFNNKIKKSRQKTILKIPGPYKSEVTRMLQLARIKAAKPLNWNQYDQIATTISKDGENAQYWLRILNDEVDFLDYKSLSPYYSSARSGSHLLTWKEELDRLVGLSKVKQEIMSLESVVRDRRDRQQKGLVSPHDPPRSLHLSFLGNPGTGKTTVARLVGEMYRDLGLLNKGHVVEVNYADLTDEHVGGSAKRTRERIQEAIDGVLFIDEAYQLSTNQFGQEVITTLLKPLEDDRGRLAVVLAGYTEPMKKLFELNEGLRSRIPVQNEIVFPDYAPNELFEIYQRFITEKGLIPSPEFNQTLNQLINQMHKDRDVKTFGNARAMRELADEVEKLRAKRRTAENLPVNTPITEADLPETARAYLTPTATDINTVMAELNDLIGLDNIKQTVKDLANDLETRSIRVTLGQPVEQSSINLVFSGNPGTGKTTVGRLMGKILKSVGVLRKGHLIDVRVSDFIAKYMGQTAEKTEEVCKQALDGVLFIDEAYELVPKNEQDTYRRDAIGVLMRYMDTYPHRLAVIAAGYPQDMQDFIASNPGLTRRFSTFIYPDYTNNELLEILHLKVSALKIGFPAAAAQRALCYFETERERAKRNREPFINASLVDRLLSIMKTNQNKRYMETREPSLLKSFIPDDIPGAPIIHQEQADQTFQPIYQHYDLVSRLPASKITNIHDAMNACCLIKVSQGEEQGTGTGFIVSEDGHLITAYHVIKGAETIQVRLNGQEAFRPATIVGLDENWDIAVLRLPNDYAYPYISIAPEGCQVEIMQEIRVLGFPLGVDYGNEITVTKGPVSSKRQKGNILQVDASMTHGSSGGPVLDQENGYVVGIVHSGAEDVRSRINFATSTQIIYQRLGTSPAF